MSTSTPSTRPPRWLRRVALALTAMASLTTPLIVGHAAEADEPNSTSSDYCALQATLPQPPPGLVAIQQRQVNAVTCEVSAGPVQFVTPEQAAVLNPPDPTASSRPLPTSSGGSGTGAMALTSACGAMHTRSTVKDNNLANIVINAVNTDTSWCWDGSIVTSYDSGGEVQYHEEKALGICNPGGCGWRPVDIFNVVSDGCAGCDHATIHTHSDFDYKGMLDPTGTQYFNHLNNYPRVNNDGTWYCELYTDFKKKPASVFGVITFFNWTGSCF